MRGQGMGKSIVGLLFLLLLSSTCLARTKSQMGLGKSFAIS
jgi:hypothetical protein